MDPKTLQTSIQKHIAKLQSDGSVVTKMGKNTDGVDLPLEQIKFDNERGFLFEKVNCLQSLKYKLGSCKCPDHASEHVVDISPQEAFSRLTKMEEKKHWESLPSDEKGKKAKREMTALEQINKMLTSTPGNIDLPRRERRK